MNHNRLNRPTGATFRQKVDDDSTVFTDMFPVNADAQSDPIRRAFAGDMFDMLLNLNISNSVLCGWVS